MGTVRETLQLLITGDSSGAVRAIKETGAAASKDLTSTQSKLALISGGLTKFGAGAVVAGAGIAAFGVKMSNAYVGAARDALKLQRVTGATAEDASRLGVVAQQSGIQVDRLAKAFVFLSKTSATPKGAEALKSLGVDLEDVNGKAKPLPQVLSQLAAKFESMPNGVEKNRVALALFGRAGADLLPLLNKGAAGIDAIIKKSDELGLTLNQKDLDGVKQYTKAQRDLQLAFKGLEVQVGRIAFPAVSSSLQTAAGVAKGAASAFNSLPDPLKQAAGNIGAVGAGSLIAVGSLSVLAGQALKLRDSFTTVGEDGVRSLNGIGVAAKGIGVAAAFVAAGYAIDGFMKHADDAAQATNRFKKAVSKGDPSSLGFLDQAGADVEGLLDHVKGAIPGVSDSFAKFGKEGAANIANVDRAIGDYAKSGHWNDVKLAIKSVTDAANDPRNAAVRPELLGIVKDYTGKLHDAADAAKATGKASQEAGDNVQGAGDKVNDAAQAWKDYADAVKASTDPFFAAQKAGEDFAKSQSDIAAAQAEFDKNKTPENFLKLADAQRTAVTSGLDFQATMIGLRAEIEKNPAAVDQAIATLESLKAQQPQLAGAIDQVERSIRGVGIAASGLPLSTPANVTTNASDATGRLKETNIFARQIPSVVPLNIQTNAGYVSGTLSDLIAKGQNLARIFGGLKSAAPTLVPQTGNPFGRAAGGHVNAGDLHLVGEDGPELFRSDRAGTIYPNHQLPLPALGPGASIGPAAGGTPIVQNITFNGVVSDEQWVIDAISKANRRGMTALQA